MTHRLIGLFAYAKTKEDAIAHAETNLNQLSIETSIEGGHLFGNEYFSWDDLPVGMDTAVLAESPVGKTLIDQLWKAQLDQFLSHLNKVRTILAECSSDEIMEGKFMQDHDPKFVAKWQGTLGSIGYYIHHLSLYSCSNIVYLYDDGCESVENRDHFQCVLTKYRCLYEDAGKPNPNADKDVWLVVADVHF